MTALASTVTQTVTAPCQANGAAAVGDVGAAAASSAVANGAVGGDTAGAAAGGAPGALGIPSGGIGVTVVSVPPELHTSTKESPPQQASVAVGAGAAGAVGAAGATTSVLSVPAPTLASLAPLPAAGSADAGGVAGAPPLQTRKLHIGPFPLSLTSTQPANKISLFS
jgi:hypothetical protein